MQETLYDGVSNPVSFNIADNDGVVIPFISNGVTRMDLHVNCQIISSAADTLGNITWTDDGVVNITSDNNVGAITPDILHTAKLVVFDPAHPEPDSGQLLIAPDMKYSNLKLKVKYSSMPKYKVYGKAPYKI